MFIYPASLQYFLVNSLAFSLKFKLFFDAFLRVVLGFDDIFVVLVGTCCSCFVFGLIKLTISDDKLFSFYFNFSFLII